MSSIVSISDNVTEVRIIINAPLLMVSSVVTDIAKELDLENVDPQVELENVLQATKNWWFDKIISQKTKQIEAYAQTLAEETKTALMEELNNSQLRGA